MFDLVLRNGLVVDGTGNPWFKADVGIKDGKIGDIGRSLSPESDGVLDVGHHVVAPGFIDMHTHSDFSLLVSPYAESKIRQGVKTEVVGNCGSSAAPLNDFLKEEIRKTSPVLEEAKLQLDWSTVDEYLERLERNKTALKVVPLVGNGNIRALVLDFDAQKPTKRELKEMRGHVRRAMQDGAFGLSSGLIYPPSCYADTEELVELCRTVAEFGGIYTSHIRGEGHNLIDSVREAVRIGEESGVPVEISHHKASGKSNWGKIKQTLQVIEQARARGVDVTCDVYPYVAGSTGLDALLPAYAWEGGVEALIRRLRNPKTRQKLRHDMEEAKSDLTRAANWNSVMISYCKGHRDYEGRRISEISKLRKKDPYDLVFDLLIEEAASVAIVIFTMSERDMRTVLGHSTSMIGSDSAAIAPYGVLGKGKPHPRAYGTFPRILGEYVRKRKIMTLENAIRKMTSLPARRLGLRDRGIIERGMWADVTVFDPETVMDKATYSDPRQYPSGIRYVIVNGEVTIENGQHTRALNGRILRLHTTMSQGA